MDRRGKKSAKGNNAATAEARFELEVGGSGPGGNEDMLRRLQLPK